VEDAKSTNALIETIAGCRIYDLEQERFRGMPTHPAHMPGYLYTLYRQHRSTYKPEEHGLRSSASGLIITMEHAGTHIDALCHQAYDMKMHGDLPVDHEIETPFGFTKLGVETIPPIVARGILLDVAGFKGVDHLPDKYEITEHELQDCASAEGLKLSKDDVVLVRTGYGQFWRNTAKYMNAAGVSLEASRWLADHDIFAVGSDNSAWEVADAKDLETNTTIPSHVLLLIERGIHIIEHLNLEELAEEKRYTFVFVCLPLRLRGATGSPVRPIAISLM
jgi:kynurenine formamidase